MKSRPIHILKSLGPAFILASVVLGPGSITVASSVGSESGYTLLWIVVISAVMMMVYTTISVRFGLTHNETLLQTISKNYGKYFAIAIGFTAFFAATSWHFGNNSGVGIAMYEIINIEK